MVTSGTGDFEYSALEMCLKFVLSVLCLVRLRYSHGSSSWCMSLPVSWLLSIIVNIIFHV